MSDETNTPVHLTQEDVVAFAAGLDKSIQDLTAKDYAALAAQHGGSIVIDQPATSYGLQEEEHRAYVPPDGVPLRVPMLALKLALYDFGVYTDVEDGARANPLAWIYWTAAVNAERKDERIIQMALGLGWFPPRLDDLFVLAGSK